MLNRRLIRIRAMQALYAYETAKAANFELAKEVIADAFAPDLNSMEKQDKAKLQALSQLGQQILTNKYALQPTEVKLEATEEVLNVVSKAKEFFELRNRKDFDYYTQRTMAEAEQVYHLYLQLLMLFVELGKRSKDDAKHEGISRLSDNAIVKALAHSLQLESLLLRRGNNWENEAGLVTKLYREVIRTNQRYTDYCQTSNHSLEDDLALLKYLLKNVFIKHEVITSYFEKEHIYWQNDIETLRSMVAHTIQDFVETEKIQIQTLDDQWTDNREFLRTLFRKSIEEDAQLMKIMIPKLNNWDVERVALIDKLLIRMGVIELINFPSIPVKVTINEIIEIAKNYSSEKSGTFINGILDNISKDLVKDGTIKKSGRGMLDNK